MEVKLLVDWLAYQSAGITLVIYGKKNKIDSSRVSLETIFNLGDIQRLDLFQDFIEDFFAPLSYAFLQF